MENLFEVNKTWKDDFKAELSPEIDEIDLELLEVTKTCDEFMTYFKCARCRGCKTNKNQLNDLAYLVRLFLERQSTNEINLKYSWIAKRTLYDYPIIKSGFKSIQHKLKQLNEFPELKLFFTKAPSIIRVAKSLRKSHLQRYSWLELDDGYFFRAMVKKLLTFE